MHFSKTLSDLKVLYLITYKSRDFLYFLLINVHNKILHASRGHMYVWLPRKLKLKVTRTQHSCGIFRRKNNKNLATGIA